MNRIENLLRDSIGLHAPTIGSSVVEQTIRSRMARLGLTNHEAYLELLRKSPAEWNNLVEIMVVTETWFFREKHPFAALVRLVMEEWLPAHPSGTLRLLSAACATGEEPCSMAMALLDAGFPRHRLQIDAVDISARALAFAQRGIYGRNSFRGGDLDFRNRYFLPARGGHVLNPAVRRLVRYQRGNILSPDTLSETGVYDFIFCRNLLIYFDRPTQAATLAKLRRLLVPRGVLFTGSAELPLALEHGFRTLNLPRGFACRRAEAAHSSAPHTRRNDSSPAKSPDLVNLPVSVPGALPTPAAAHLTRLARARELAVQGQLAEARALCESHLREHGVSSEAFFILGLVQDAAGADTQAGEFYRKALYLEPDHLDALQQWALLSERTGRPDQAIRLRQRAGRRLPETSTETWTL